VKDPGPSVDQENDWEGETLSGEGEAAIFGEEETEFLEAFCALGL
jgi:hypothetical protein